MSLKFTPKEQFIVASVHMISDERAKKLPRDTRQAMLDYIKNRLGITNEEWHECAINIDQTMRRITEIMEDDYRNREKTPSDAELVQMETAFRDNISDVDLDDYNSIDSSGKSMLEDIKDLKKRFGL